MRLLIDPLPALSVFAQELGLVISASEQRPPEVFVKEGSVKPDRHFLLSLVQTIAMAVEEMDPEFITFMEADSITLENAGRVKDLPNGLIIARSGEGSLAGLAVPEPRAARRLARETVRWFTGAIRIDIP